jgi:ribosomal protein S18 acetylase RimI-like enzyme
MGVGMDLQTWPLDRAGELAGLYNELVGRLPYRYAVSPATFQNGIQEHRYVRDGGGPFDRVREARLMVALDGAEVRGFVHAGLKVPERDGEPDDEGTIRFLIYEPGCREYGQALLTAAEDHCRGFGATSVDAFRSRCVYRFYFHEHGITELLGHVVALFRMNGYEADHGEVLLAWPDFDVPEPKPPSGGFETREHVLEGRGRLPGRALQLFKDDEQFGVCGAHSVGHFQEAEEAQDQTFVEWLRIEDGMQGRGWGRYLLERMLWDMKEIGYRHALISANTLNHRAQLFYSNLGFRVVDRSYEFVKELRKDDG